MVDSLKLVGVRSNTEALREHIATNQWYEIPLKHHHQAVSRSIMQQLMFERGQQIFAEGGPSHLTYRIIPAALKFESLWVFKSPAV